MTDLKIFPTLTKILAFSLAINGILILGHYLSVARHGTGIIIAFSHLMIGAIFAAFPLVALSLAAILFRSIRKVAIVAFLGGLIHIGISYIGINRAEEIRHNGLAAFTIRSRPLIDAINAFEVRCGRPPVELAELVPEFLPAVPDTGMRASPEYRYSTNLGKIMHRKSNWILRVPTMTGTGWDEMIYLPGQDYRGRAGVRPVNDWAYIVE